MRITWWFCQDSVTGSIKVGEPISSEITDHFLQLSGNGDLQGVHEIWLKSACSSLGKRQVAWLHLESIDSISVLEIFFVYFWISL